MKFVNSEAHLLYTQNNFNLLFLFINYQPLLLSRINPITVNLTLEGQISRTAKNFVFYTFVYSSLETLSARSTCIHEVHLRQAVFADRRYTQLSKTIVSDTRAGDQVGFRSYRAENIGTRAAYMRVESSDYGCIIVGVTSW